MGVVGVGCWDVATVLATFGELTAFWLPRRNVGQNSDSGHISKAHRLVLYCMLWRSLATFVSARF
ncbi:hypothetical protein GCM10022296_00900 [Secundilactobacillus similis DSM 23365 = JCM 2765]